MTETTTHKTLGTLLAQAAQRRRSDEAIVIAAEEAYSQRVREKTAAVLIGAGIDESELRWIDGEYHWVDYSFMCDEDGWLIISYVSPQTGNTIQEGLAAGTTTAQQIADLMLQLQIRSDENDQLETFAVYEAEQYAFPNKADWELYAQRYDEGWKVQHHDFLLAGGIAFLVVVWVKDFKVVD